MNIYRKSQIPAHLLEYFKPGQLGLESTPEEYIAGMVEVFRCVRDLLADDGTLWVNIGDSYSASGERKNNNGEGKSTMGWPGQSSETLNKAVGMLLPKVETGCKPKDLIGIPWMLAFALRADGWYLRQDIIWHKPNPMPESVTDRCTKAHEYLFLLSKNARYYFDQEPIREQVKPENEGWVRAPKYGADRIHGAGVAGVTAKQYDEIKGANRRSVWTIPSAPYGRAHFATYPPALIKPCILAGSKPGQIVLDPFLGSGTTAQVAQDLGRHWIGCELNTDYKQFIDERTAQTALIL